MADQVIDNGVIKNVQDDNWQKGECDGEWIENRVHTEQFTEQYT